MADIQTIVCKTCGAPGEGDFSGAMPVIPGEWQALLAIQGWEYYCSRCWALYLADTAIWEVSRVA